MPLIRSIPHTSDYFPSTGLFNDEKVPAEYVPILARNGRPGMFHSIDQVLRTALKDLTNWSGRRGRLECPNLRSEVASVPPRRQDQGAPQRCGRRDHAVSCWWVASRP